MVDYYNKNIPDEDVRKAINKLNKFMNNDEALKLHELIKKEREHIWHLSIPYVAKYLSISENAYKMREDGLINFRDIEIDKLEVLFMRKLR